MEASKLMGEISFTKDGIETTIHDDGSTSKRMTGEIQCDDCQNYVPPVGTTIRDEYTGEAIMWICVGCRSK